MRSSPFGPRPRRSRPSRRAQRSATVPPGEGDRSTDTRAETFPEWLRRAATKGAWTCDSDHAMPHRERGSCFDQPANLGERALLFCIAALKVSSVDGCALLESPAVRSMLLF